MCRVFAFAVLALQCQSSRLTGPESSQLEVQGQVAVTSEDTLFDQLATRLTTQADLLISIVPKMLVAYEEGFQDFAKPPPNATRSLALLSANLWDVLLVLMDPGETDGAKAVELKTRWDKMFTEDLPSVVNNITDSVIRLQNNETGQLSNVIVLTFSAFASVAGVIFDTDGNTLFSGISNFINSAQDIRDAYEAGNWTRTIELTYTTLNATAYQFMYVNETASAGFLTFMATVDEFYKVFDELSRKYYEGKTNAKECYRTKSARESVMPTFCAEGFVHDGERTCVPDHEHGADCFAACGNTAGPCAAFCGDRWCCKKGDSANPPECQQSTYYTKANTTGAPEDYYQCVHPTQSLLQMAETQEVQASSAETATHAVEQKAEATSLEKTLVGKTAAAVAPFGSEPAQCDIYSPYNLYQDGVCSAGCTDGFNTDDGDCYQTCGGERAIAGDFGLALGGMDIYSFKVCATSSARITAASTDLITAVTKAVGVFQSSVGLVMANATVDWNAIRNDFGLVVDELAKPECDFGLLGRSDLVPATA
jgi:hypothetical protein